MSTLPLEDIVGAIEAATASKQPLRSNLASELNSMNIITQVIMLLWPLNAFVF